MKDPNFNKSDNRLSKKIAKTIFLSGAIFFILFSTLLILRSNAEFGRSGWPCKTALILYDQDKILDTGSLFSVMLASTLRHFNIDYKIKTMQEYNRGDCARFDAIFYLGDIDESFIPKEFLRDIYNSKKVIVWFKYNLDELQVEAGAGFIKKFGFSFMKRMDQKNDSPELFDTFYYKNHVINIRETDEKLPDLELVAVKIVEPKLAKIVSSAKSSKTQEEVPYIVRAKNFWFVADIPFFYLDSKARYLILCDCLHDILRSDHQQQHKALVRIEDANPFTKPDELEEIIKFLQDEKVPFSIGVIPFFRDQTGKFLKGPPELTFSDSTDILELLKNAQDKGASIVMHGVTHQMDNPQNPASQLTITGVGYEFWDTENNTPIKDDSVEYIKARLERGKNELLNHGLNPVAFETPHYTASALDYRVFAQEFDFLYDQVVYHLYDTTSIPIPPEKEKESRENWVNQFFPYVIHGDYYGLVILPASTIDELTYNDAIDIDVLNKSLSRLMKQIEAVKIVRDGYVSFYIHPFLIKVMEEHNINGFEVLKKLIDEARKDFEFVDLKSILKK